MIDDAQAVRAATVDLLRELKDAQIELRLSDRIRIAAFMVAATAIVRESSEDDHQASEVIDTLVELGFTFPVHREWLVRH